MKKIFSLLAFIGLFTFSSAQLPRYTITGKISGAEGTRFQLLKIVNGRLEVMDTATTVNGIFKMTRGSVAYPQTVNLVTEDKKHALSFYLENSKIEIAGKLDSLGDAKITGSKTQDDILSLNNYMKLMGEKYKSKGNELMEATKKNEMSRVKDIRIQMDEMMKDAISVEKEFVIKHPASFATPDILRNIASGLQATEIEAILNAMDPEVAKTPIITELKYRINILKFVDIGKKAPDFTLNDTKGNPVSLSSIIGSKLLLIDFWAAWCSPCRAENPNVVKVYNEFHNKGFDILGVSLDRSDADWRKAITDDKLNWTHVSDLQYWNSAAAKLYGVNSIPANFLLDKNGIIIAKNLRGTDLYNKVKEMTDTK